VPFTEVNALINRAHIGIAAGADDGCPGVITEYMLAGLPVLMNADICCGLRFLTPETGWTAKPRDFALAIQMALDEAPHRNPRRHALEHWGWGASVRRFESILEEHGYKLRRP
jgi:glycosyltransferase involved in cell wall biosynthesis